MCRRPPRRGRLPVIALPGTAPRSGRDRFCLPVSSSAGSRRAARQRPARRASLPPAAVPPGRRALAGPAAVAAQRAGMLGAGKAALSRAARPAPPRSPGGLRVPLPGHGAVVARRRSCLPGGRLVLRLCREVLMTPAAAGGSRVAASAALVERCRAPAGDVSAGADPHTWRGHRPITLPGTGRAGPR